MCKTRFVQLSAGAYAAVDPSSPAAEAATRAAAMEATNSEIQPILKQYTQEEELVFPHALAPGVRIRLV